MERNSKKSRLTLWICGAIIAAIAVALAFPFFAVKLHAGGEIFLRLLKMVVVPLVVMSVMSGILGLGDIRKLGRPGACAVLYYLGTTILAVIIGLAVVNIIQPGVGAVDGETLAKIRSESEVITSGKTPDISSILNNLMLMLFTDNLISSAANTELLPLIAFSIIFAGLLSTMGPRVDNIILMIEQVNDALMSFVLLLMKTAPLGIFCLVTARFGKAQAEGKFIETLSQTGWYFITVLLGLAVHAFIILPLIYWIFQRKNPFRFMRHMSQALLTAFSTASSSVTLPVTMDCAINKAGISKRSTEFVLPLGATINMDGTALYEAAAALFIAQALGMDITLAQQAIIALTATLAAIGAAGIPEAGLVTMIIVLNAVNIPVEYIGLILSVDWLLDRFRTAVNVYGDSVGTAVVEKTME